jgi:formylmethanofuran dehydrogenase subunit E
MARILLLIVLVWILFQIVKRMTANADSKPAAKPDEKFVQCANCGCHVPESESQIKNNKIVCNNPECLQK